MDIVENNKLFVEFLGWSKSQELENGYCAFNEECNSLLLSEMLFHLDWNWLAVVVDKIETTSYKVPEKFRRGFMRNTLRATGHIHTDYDDRTEFLGWSSYCTLGAQIIWDSTLLGENVASYKTKMEAIYNACLGFIKWYNQQK